MKNANVVIWDALYENGAYLIYPSEVLVQLYFRAFGKELKAGSFLDHGCGSGNNSEFLAKRGWSVTGSDTSQQALNIQSKRMASESGKHTQVLLDSEKPLTEQLNGFDNILCWDALCYNQLAKAKADSRDLMKLLAAGGYLFVNMPTMRHEFATTGRLLEDGSFENRRVGTRQEGAIMSIPENLDELVSWFKGLEIVESGHFTFDFAGFREFMFLVGRKAIAE
jgi:SAM-dependent methyltransferase